MNIMKMLLNAADCLCPFSPLKNICFKTIPRYLFMITENTSLAAYQKKDQFQDMSYKIVHKALHTNQPTYLDPYQLFKITSS